MSCLQKGRRYRRILAATILIGGVLQWSLPAWAQTAAGTDIINEATATYEDPNNPGTTIEATSNQVTITVAEVAGIAVTAAGFNDLNTGSVSPGDVLTFDFLVENIGNDPTQIFVPGLNNITATNGTITAVEVIEIDGTPLGAAVPVAAAGGTTADLDGAGTGITYGANPQGSVPAGSNFRVRVTVTTAAGATAGSIVSVQLGDTLPPGPTETEQNIADATDGVNLDEVRTVDNADGVTGETAGIPANGEREAAALEQSTPVGQQTQNLAMATVLKQHVVPVVANSPATNDDEITYVLGLNVANPTPPPTGFNPAALEGTAITLDSAAATRILISDAIPTGTSLVQGSVVAPAGWTAVYATEPTTGGGAIDALSVDWSTTPPANQAAADLVTRVGFVADAGVTLAPGSSEPGFTFTVVTSSLPAAGGQVANLAQAFGETVGDTTNEVVYDESGDPNFNNFDDSGNPPDPTGTDYIPATDTGVADVSADGVDSGNDNTGSGEDGEVNLVTITQPGAILNGPDGVPGAVGPNDNNDDFQNQSTDGTDGVGNAPAPGDPVDPQPVTFTNTVNNPNTTPLNNVVLRPIQPSVAATRSGNPATSYGADGDIPDNTTVTVTLPSGGQSATYNYTAAGGFALTSASHVSLTLVGSATQNYTVAVDLPGTAEAVTGYSIPIVAFVEDGTSFGEFDGDAIFNIKVDRVYTGYVELQKQARILDTDGTTELEAFTATPTVNPEPGQFIEYQITYTNISESPPGAGVGNVTLDASNVVIEEDGTQAPNNWAGTTTHQQSTAASNGTVEYFNGASTLGNSDPVDGATVSEYVNSVGTLAPQSTGTLTFRRQVD